MDFPSSSALDADWSTCAAQAPTSSSYSPSDPLAQDSAYYLDALDSFAGAQLGALVPPSTVAEVPRDAYYAPQDTGGLRIDGFCDPAYTFAPRRSVSSDTTSSSALPALSPASSLSASSGFVSPYQHFSAANSPEQYRGLLPPAHVQDKIYNSGFAELQESYIQGHSPTQSSYPTPSSYALVPSPSVPPSTPRRHAPASSHLWRSPTSHTTTSSPATSPYHRPTTPRRVTGSYPSDLSSSARSGRRGSTGGYAVGLESPSRRSTPRRSHGPITTTVDANGSPTKSIRRAAARLSIEVPPYGAGSPSRVPPPAQPVFTTAPSTARPQVAPVDGGLSEQSVREVEQMLGELGPILANDGMFGKAQVQNQPTPTSRMAQSRPVALVPPPGSPARQAPQFGSFGSHVPPQAPFPQRYSPSDILAPQSISISGVTLAQEDLALLDTPSLGGDGFEPTSPAYSDRSYPASAPAWRTTFDAPPAPPPPAHADAQPSQYQPAYEHAPFYSAPLSASSSLSYTLASSTSSLAIPQQYPQYTTSSTAFRASSAQRDALSGQSSLAASVGRRRSSVDSAAVHNTATSTYRPYPYPPPSPLHSNAAYPRPALAASPMQQRPSYPPSPASQSWLQQQHQQPRHVPQFPTVLQPVPPYQPDRPTTPEMPKSPARVAKTSSPQKGTPKKRASPKKKPGAMFINYSSADSKKLLTGVAPSGSTKKRPVEDDEAAKQRTAEKTVPAVAAAP
ncbi:hypothetical protein JCM11641_003015 [Rhodosporidiobolus odoratus]